MKTNKTVVLISVFFLSFAQAGFGQIREVDFIKGGINDAQILFKEYLTPYANDFGANLNGGWYNTAKPHKLGGFDITVSVNTAWAPPAARTMDLSKYELEAQVNGGPLSPTVAGKRTDVRPVLSYYESYTNPVSGLEEAVKIAEYTTPNGTGVTALPLPMAQLSIGLPIGTDVSVRYLPSLDFGNAGSIELWGVGGKHSIMQHIPGLKRLPILDISAQGGYTDLKSHANVNFEPDAIAVDLTSDPLVWKEQKIQMNAKAWTINLVASQTLPVITFYQGIGYSNTKTTIALIGSYPISTMETDESNDYFGQVVVRDEDIYEDPINMEIQNRQDLRLNAGMRLKLGVLTIHFDYTKANYSVFTTGLGISFR